MGLKELRDRLSNDDAFRESYEMAFPFEMAAEAIQQLRADLDLTQRELAQEVGSPQSVIARAESGRQSFEISLFSRIARAAGMAWKPLFYHPESSRYFADVSSNVVPLRAFPLRQPAPLNSPTAAQLDTIVNPPAPERRERVAS